MDVNCSSGRCDSVGVAWVCVMGKRTGGVVADGGMQDRGRRRRGVEVVSCDVFVA